MIELEDWEKGMSRYQLIESAIIAWSLDNTKTAGSLTREIESIIEYFEKTKQR